jgi:transcription elongation factor GreA-like protein
MCFAALLAVFQARRPMSSIMALSYRLLDDMMLLLLLLLLTEKRGFQKWILLQVLLATCTCTIQVLVSQSSKIALDATAVNCYSLMRSTSLHNSTQLNFDWLN